MKAYSRLSSSLKSQLTLKFQDAEVDIAVLTGTTMGHFSQQRLVERQSFKPVEVKQGANEVVLMEAKCG
ncbi:MAG: hypothetical protein AAF609_10515 [Cyanobacteria bacterium P01_C01_bin.120]